MNIEDLIASRRPGWTLPQPFYCDENIFKLDFERIFRPYWLFAGHVSQIPEPGDYFTYRVCDDPIIILRDNERRVRAFFNTCRHRGSLVCTEHAGHTKSFVCPYHQWAYRLDGSLAGAKHMPEGFDKSKFGLHVAHCNIMEGLIFISLAEEPVNFEPLARDIIPRLSPHRLDHSKICQTRHYEVRANWKVIDENARECYHCPGSHPEYCSAVISAAAVNSPYKMAEHEVVKQDREAYWRSLGLETTAKRFGPDNWYSVARNTFHPGVVTESLDGQPVAPLMGDFSERDMGVLGIGIYPNFLFEASSDHAVCLRFTPISATLTSVEMSWLVHEDAIEGKDYRVEDVEAVWKATAEQDWKLCENNQLGISSSRYEPGPFAPIESGCEHFVNWYLKNLRSPGGRLKRETAA